MALSRRLIELLREDPDDVERYGVVADQLQAKGDLRGELISLELARLNANEGSPKWRALGREIDTFRHVHAKVLLGGLWTATTTSAFEWRLGFIRKACLWTSAVAVPPVTTGRAGRRVAKRRANRLLKQTDELLRLESSALLESLSLASSYNSQLFVWDAAARVAEGAPATLHVLALRDLYGRAMPEWEPLLQREIVWRRQVLTLQSDTLSLESLAELFQ
ncbi:MAG: hypothetical protein JNK82_45185 [Myxococcaceae bacterium]|nr:hypothetical protein [Myxococcaceae bacterium]